MKKIYSFFAVSLFSAGVFAQAFTVTYDFAEPVVTGQGVVDAGVVAGSTDLTVTPFTATGLSSTTTTNRFVWSGATTATTLDLTKYFEVTLTPGSGVNMSVTSLTFRLQRSGTGPRYCAVRSSVDGYASNLPASISPANAELEVASNAIHFVNDGITTGQNGSTITISNINNVSTATSFRIYFYEAEAAGGTFSVDDVVIAGSTATSLGTSENFSVKSNFVKNTFVKDEAITFGADVKDVKVYNMFGQVVKTASVKNNGTLNVAELQKGSYIVTGTVNNQPVSQKILKD